MVTATVRDSFYFRKVVPTCFPSECGESRLSELFFGKGFVYKKLGLVHVYGDLGCVSRPKIQNKHCFFHGRPPRTFDNDLAAASAIGDSAGRPAAASMVHAEDYTHCRMRFRHFFPADKDPKRSFGEGLSQHFLHWLPNMASSFFRSWSNFLT